MSFIRRRRKRIYYVVLGVGIIAGILIGAMITCTYVSIKQKKAKALEESNKIPFLILKEDKEPGEVIGEGDVTEVMLPGDSGLNCMIKKQSIIGKQAKASLKEGMILYDNMLYVEPKCKEGFRKHSYSYIRQSDTLKAGDLIDVRISFPNGADFIVLSKKTVLDATKGQEQTSREEFRVWMHISEEEILRMSSAVVDAYINEGAYLYAVTYVSDMQDAAIVNYPVNEVVEELIKKDPNIINIAQEHKTLEMRKHIDGMVIMDEENKVKQNNQATLDFYE